MNRTLTATPMVTANNLVSSDTPEGIALTLEALLHYGHVLQAITSCLFIGLLNLGLFFACLFMIGGILTVSVHWLLWAITWLWWFFKTTYMYGCPRFVDNHFEWNTEKKEAKEFKEP